MDIEVTPNLSIARKLRRLTRETLGVIAYRGSVMTPRLTGAEQRMLERAQERSEKPDTDTSMLLINKIPTEE